MTRSLSRHTYRVYIYPVRPREVVNRKPLTWCSLFCFLQHHTQFHTQLQTDRPGRGHREKRDVPRLVTGTVVKGRL